MEQAEVKKSDSDEQTMMNQVAMECMDAIQKGDKESFLNCMQILVHHAISEMQEPEHSEG